MDRHIGSILVVAAALVLITLIVCLVRAKQYETRTALENGYEQRPIYPGSSNLMWVKAPGSATNAATFQR